MVDDNSFLEMIINVEGSSAHFFEVIPCFCLLESIS